jgi:hypothetical protein
MLVMFTSRVFSVILLVALMVCALVNADTNAQNVNHLKSVAFDKASSAGCIARFTGEKTDTHLREGVSCGDDNSNVS